MTELLLELLSDFPFVGGNQGGTANIFVPEAVVGLGAFLFERRYIGYETDRYQRRNDETDL